MAAGFIMKRGIGRVMLTERSDLAQNIHYQRTYGVEMELRAEPAAAALLSQFVAEQAPLWRRFLEINSNCGRVVQPEVGYGLQVRAHDESGWDGNQAVALQPSSWWVVWRTLAVMASERPCYGRQRLQKGHFAGRTHRLGIGPGEHLFPLALPLASKSGQAEALLGELSPDLLQCQGQPAEIVFRDGLCCGGIIVLLAVACRCVLQQGLRCFLRVKKEHS